MDKDSIDSIEKKQRNTHPDSNVSKENSNVQQKGKPKQTNKLYKRSLLIEQEDV